MWLTRALEMFRANTLCAHCLGGASWLIGVLGLVLRVCWCAMVDLGLRPEGALVVMA